MAASLLFFGSGLTALVYQVMWMRSFGLVFGSTTRAASAVLAAFFFGMAVGNFAGALGSRGRGRALLLYALAEVTIGVGAVLVLVWLALYADVYPALYRWRPGGASGLTALQLLLAFVAMGPPCAAMGATLPLITHAVVEGESDLGRRTSALYGINTLGAFFGVLLSGFVLPVWIGTQNAVLAAAVLNLAIGAAALGLVRGGLLGGGSEAASHHESRKVERAPRDVSATGANGARRTPGGVAAERLDPLIACVVVLSGFGTLALEVLYTRLLVNNSDSSVYSFAIMLATFLIALAIGSFIVSAVVDRIASPWSLIAWSSALASVAILLSPSVFGSLELGDPKSESFSYLRTLVGFAVLTIGPPAVLVAIALPTAWRISIRHADETGGRIGRLTSLNTLAAVAGSLASGFVFLPVLGLGGGISLVALLYAIMAAIGFWRSGASAIRFAGLGVLAVVLALLLLTQAWSIVPLRLRPGERILHYYDGESGTVAVTRRKNGVLALRINNRYGLGNTADEAVRLQRGIGRLGLLLADDARSAAFIGVATGISLSAVTEFPKLQRVLAVELVPGVTEASELFVAYNSGVFRDPRVELLVADGRNHLRGVDERFDVIVGDLFVPWHAGTGYLYTIEHFVSVSRRLTPKGVFVQWVQVDQLAVAELKVLMATFGDAFPDMALCRVVDSKLIGLVGHGEEGSAREIVQAPGLVGSEFSCTPAPRAEWSDYVVRNSDDFPVIEFSAASSHLVRSPARRARMKRFLTELFGEDPWGG